MPESSGVHILLAEDNSELIESMLHRLRRERLVKNFHAARDGADALDFLFCWGDYQDCDNNRVGLIVLDLDTHKVDAIELLRQIKSHDRTKAIPVVVLASDPRNQKTLAAYNLGAAGYIQKPVDFDSFCGLVKQII